MLKAYILYPVVIDKFLVELHYIFILSFKTVTYINFDFEIG